MFASTDAVNNAKKLNGQIINGRILGVTSLKPSDAQISATLKPTIEIGQGSASGLFASNPQTAAANQVAALAGVLGAAPDVVTQSVQATRKLGPASGGAANRSSLAAFLSLIFDF